MARPERFELPTFWFVARHSIQLSYGRVILVFAGGCGYPAGGQFSRARGGRSTLVCCRGRSPSGAWVSGGALDLEIAEFAVVNGIADVHGAAADAAVFNVVLIFAREVQLQVYRFPAGGADHRALQQHAQNLSLRCRVSAKTATGSAPASPRVAIRPGLSGRRNGLAAFSSAMVLGTVA